jgi:hypothetical protein
MECRRRGFGRRKVPQLVRPRTTPERARMREPAVLAILGLVLAGKWKRNGMRRRKRKRRTYSFTSASLPGRTWWVIVSGVLYDTGTVVATYHGY